MRLDVCEAHLDLTAQPVLRVLEEQEQQSGKRRLESLNTLVLLGCWSYRKQLRLVCDDEEEKGRGAFSPC